MKYTLFSIVKFSKDRRLFFNRAIALTIGVVLLLLESGCFLVRPLESLPIIGLDSNGQVKKYNLGGNFRTHRYGKLLNDIKNQSILRLESIKSASPSPWHISQVSVGLGLGAALDLKVVGVELESLIELRIIKGE
ncbi:MAG: hypothetical protein HQK52_03085 [Oligoflexia bacterium]|nr:hypothetical protein [Oligoflexia bacterium]